MFKRIFGSKPASIILDAIGVFSLASFLFLGFYLRFIVDILPSCYFTDALIVYVECGKGVIGRGFKILLPIFLTLDCLDCTAKRGISYVRCLLPTPYVIFFKIVPINFSSLVFSPTNCRNHLLREVVIVLTRPSVIR